MDTAAFETWRWCICSLDGQLKCTVEQNSGRLASLFWMLQTFTRILVFLHIAPCYDRRPDKTKSQIVPVFWSFAVLSIMPPVAGLTMLQGWHIRCHRRCLHSGTGHVVVQLTRFSPSCSSRLPPRCLVTCRGLGRGSVRPLGRGTRSRTTESVHVEWRHWLDEPSTTWHLKEKETSGLSNAGS